MIVQTLVHMEHIILILLIAQHAIINVVIVQIFHQIALLAEPQAHIEHFYMTILVILGALEIYMGILLLIDVHFVIVIV